MADDLDALLAQLTPEERVRLAARLMTGDLVSGDKIAGDKVGRDKIVEPQGSVIVDGQGRINGVAVGINLGRIVYGRDPEEDERRRLAWYLDSLANKLYRLPLRGIEQRLDQGEGMAMPNIYVMLATSNQKLMLSGGFSDISEYCDVERVAIQMGVQQPETAPLVRLKDQYKHDWALPHQAITELQIGKEGGKEPIQLFRHSLATEAVQQHRHLVLLGDPGGGKSTFLRHLAWALAQRGLDQHGQAPALFGWPDDARVLPLLLPLRTLASRIITYGAQPSTLAAALSTELASAYNVREAEAFVEQALHSNTVVLLLDGLDEVSLEHARAHAGRATVLRVVREFAQLYSTARVVLTCRTRAFDDAMRAELGWHVETIAPFTLGQIRHFIPAWYGELAASGQIEQSTAVLAGQKLITAITDLQRPRLRDLATTPLLLTMMAIVLYSQGELPRDRPQLYERILDLLLGQWDKVRDGASLAEAVGKPEWQSRDFLPLLDRLCYEAHRDTTSEDGRGRLSRGALYTALIDFFRQAQLPQPWYVAQCCLDYFEQRSGLIAADGPDSYVFAHLTLQEHGAGRYMAVQSEDPSSLMLQHRGEDRWREPIMLGSGLLRPADLNTLLTDLIDPEEHERAKPITRWYRDLIMAAEIGADRDWNLLRTRPAIKVDRLQRDVRRGLVALLADKAQPLPSAERVRAGFLLGDLGDPRLPVSIDQWQREIATARAGKTDGYFCPMPLAAGKQSLWIARYPITNVQLQEWSRAVQLPPRRHDSDANFNRPNQPAIGVNCHLAASFCAWLSQQTATTIRLPSAKEWAAAAHGPDRWRYPWGNEYLRDRAAIKEDQDSRAWPYTTPAGCYPAGASPVGALDMAGNVWEWTSSVWQPDTETGRSENNGQKQVLCGGGYSSTRKQALTVARIGLEPGVGMDNGFRVVLKLVG